VGKPDETFKRKVDSGSFSLDDEHMTITDEAGHAVEFPADSVDELRDVVDAAAQQKSPMDWFRPDEANDILRGKKNR
jgi:hypothetical protein